MDAAAMLRRMRAGLPGPLERAAERTRLFTPAEAKPNAKVRESPRGGRMPPKGLERAKHRGHGCPREENEAGSMDATGRTMRPTAGSGHGWPRRRAAAAASYTSSRSRRGEAGAGRAAASGVAALRPFDGRPPRQRTGEHDRPRSGRMGRATRFTSDGRRPERCFGHGWPVRSAMIG
jgi:hypothetical protein